MYNKRMVSESSEDFKSPLSWVVSAQMQRGNVSNSKRFVYLLKKLKLIKESVIVK
jgi:hypothetical protein